MSIPTINYDQFLAETQDFSYLPTGFKDAGTPSGDTIIDAWYSLDAALQGGRLTARQGVFGDTLDVDVVVPDGLGGWVVARQVAIALPLDASNEIVLSVNISMSLPNTTRLRCTYHSVGADPPQLALALTTWFSSAQLQSEGLVVRP
jgi:hypothetical protein